MEELKNRMEKVENDVKELFEKYHALDRQQSTTFAEIRVILNNINESLDGIKNTLSTIQKRPSKIWDKILFGFLGALGTGIGTAILVLILK